MSTKAFFITLVAVAVGSLFINGFNHEEYVANSSNTNEVTQSQTDNLSSSDIPIDTPVQLEKCNFGITVRNIIPDKCKYVQNIIIQNKTHVKATIQKIIDSLNQKEKTYEDQLKQDKDYTSCFNNSSSNPSSYESTMSQLNCVSFKQSMQGNDQAGINNIDSQILTYSNFLDNIDYGRGNGACSGHDGVNPAAGSGNIGQVICTDGWTGSSVYYYNVIEDINYLISSLN